MAITLRPGQLPVLIVNLIAIIGFSLIFLSRGNMEFLMYVGVIIFFLVLILFTNHRVFYPLPVLWGLTLWAIMHMAGGGVIVNGAVLYKLMLFEWIGEPYHILKYDQLIHTIGFAVATMLAYYLLKPHLSKSPWQSTTVLLIVVMAGLGLGALNEIVEFTATVLVPETNVGGYVNTALDLVFNLLGALLALLILWFVDKK